MNKKGLTLIELMAVIAIIAILTIMIMPGIMSVRQSVLDNSYKNKVSQIENAAKEYGQEHITELISPVTHVFTNFNNADVRELNDGRVDCIYRTVNFLISSGYLKVSNSYDSNGVENTSFTNPKTGEAMNNKSVCIRFDNNDIIKRQIVAYLVEE